MSQEPMIPQYVDLGGLECVMIKKTIRDSDFVATKSPEVIGLALLLWVAAWDQVPSGSLPSDDRALASLAGFGRTERAVADFRKIKDDVLYGWVACSDGRYYHPIMSEVVMSAWHGHTLTRYRKLQNRYAKRSGKVGCPTYKDWVEAGYPDDLTAITGEMPASRGRPKKSVEPVEPVEPDQPKQEKAAKKTRKAVPDEDEDTLDDIERSKRVEAYKVVDYWSANCKVPKPTQNTRTKYMKKILTRMKEGRTYDELIEVIDFVVRSPFYNGEQKGTVYQAFDMLFDSSEKTDKYLCKAQSDIGRQGNEPSEQQLSPDEAKRKAYIAQGCSILPNGTVMSPTGQKVGSVQPTVSG